MTARPCPQCVVEGGPWRYDEDGNVTGRCDCRSPKPTTTPAAERDAALTSTSLAHPDALNAALRIITDTAHRHETFSANTCRAEMEIAQVPGPVVGAAFGQAVRNGIIRRDGYVQSSKSNTHGHEVKQWRSLVCRQAAS